MLMGEVEFRDLGETFDAGLLEQAYQEVYLPAFPLRDEQEDPSIWTPRLLDPGSNPHLCFLVAWTHDAVGRRALLGLLVAEYYAASCCVLISYAAVYAQVRGKGLMKRLFEELRQRLESGRVSGGQAVHAVFAEIHDPAANVGDDVLDPRARLRVMARLGGQRIPIRYLQPALGPDQSPAGGLWLIAFPALAAAAPPISGAGVRAFLVEFYRELGSRDPEHDAVYAAPFGDLDTLGDGPITLEPLLD